MIARNSAPENTWEERLEEWVREVERYRLLILAALILLGFMIAALERMRPTVVEPYRQAVVGVIDPYLRLMRGAGGELTESAQTLRRREDLARENEQLRIEVSRSQAELQTAMEEIGRLTRISSLGQWKRSEDLEFIPADVTGFYREDNAAQFTINLGRLDGLEKGLPVVGQIGLIGVIRETYERSSRVQSLHDPQSAVGVSQKRLRERGVVFGRGLDAPLEFMPEKATQEIAPGDVLITSGFQNSVYPKGIVVGTIERRGSNEKGMPYGVVRAAERFTAAEEVLVIRRRTPTSDDNEGLGAFAISMGAAMDQTVREPDFLDRSMRMGGFERLLAHLQMNSRDALTTPALTTEGATQP